MKSKTPKIQDLTVKELAHYKKLKEFFDTHPEKAEEIIAWVFDTHKELKAAGLIKNNNQRPD